MKDLIKDPAVRAFIRRSKAPETFTHLAADLRARFGLDLSPEAASYLWRELRRPQSGRTSAFERNARLMAFIADRADLMTTDALLARLRQEFAAHITPSRSQLFRLVQKVRESARRNALQAPDEQGSNDG